MKKALFIIGFFFIASLSYAQVGINTVTPSAQLQINSSNQASPANNDGIIIPKIDAFPVVNPTAAQNSMLVYLTTVSAGQQPGFYYWDNASISWKEFGGTALSGWTLSGNSGTNPATNFIGTTDNKDLVFKRNSVLAGKVSSNVSYGINALFTNTSGINNTGIGHESLFSNTSGFNNVGQGLLSLYSNSSGNNNSGLGVRALNSNTTGNLNNAFGADSDVATGNLSNATAIGSNALVSSSNSIVLGSISGVNSATATASIAIGSTVPNAVFDVASSNKGILIPRVALTSTAQVLPVTNPQGGSLPTSTMVYNTQTINDVTPGFYFWKNTKWARFDIDGEGKSKYYTVLGTTDATASNAPTLLPEMTQTFTPNSSTVFVQFSVSGFNDLNSCGQNAVYFTILLDGIPIKGFQTSMENINTSADRPIWDFNTTYPVDITPGVPHTISIHWYVPAFCAINVNNNVSSPSPPGGYQAHRTLTIIDPNGGGGVVGTAPVTYIDAWKVTGNSGTNAMANFIGTTDVVDLVFKRGNIKSGLIGAGTTSFGLRSLFANTSGVFNSAFGTNSLFNNSLGSNNTSVGFNALENNSIGNNNTALGSDSLSNNTTGNNNTSLGGSTLYLNISGSNNIAIGHLAGYNETGSNKLYIENSNSTNPLIYGEFDTDLLRIHGYLEIDNIATTNNKMQLVNKNNYTHGIGDQIFGNGGDDFIISSKEGANETGGIYGDGNAISIWSAGDANQSQPAALVYFLDEDSFDVTNNNPYDNTALKSYISPVGAYVQVSDKNKKENIAKIENATDKINQISGYTYQFKLSPEEVKKGDKPIQSSGVLAQEIEKILPQAVQKNDKGDYFVDYAAITPLLIEAIKEQNNKIKILETTNSEILKRLEKLENK